MPGASAPHADAALPGRYGGATPGGTRVPAWLSGDAPAFLKDSSSDPHAVPAAERGISEKNRGGSTPNPLPRLSDTYGTPAATPVSGEVAAATATSASFGTFGKAPTSTTTATSTASPSSSTPAFLFSESAAWTRAEFSRGLVSEFVARYGKAWMEQDTEQIAALFCPDGAYKEKPGRVMQGLEAIRSYWRKQICQNEKDIEFQHVEEDMVFDFEQKQATVKWLASFERRANKRAETHEMMCFVQLATLRFRNTENGWRIQSLEEYLHPFYNIQSIKEFLVRDANQAAPRVGISLSRGGAKRRVSAHVTNARPGSADRAGCGGLEQNYNSVWDDGDPPANSGLDRRQLFAGGSPVAGDGSGKASRPIPAWKQYGLEKKKREQVAQGVGVGGVEK